MLCVVPATGFRGLGRFIDAAWPVYATDPYWVPPLRLERRLHFSRHNPFFEHAEWQAWIALRDNRPVGRISAQVDRLHLERYDDATGSFGMLEAIDDPAVFEMLLRVAESWLLYKGMQRVRGPFNLSINDECGLLVDGFTSAPSIMMGHAKPYYAKHLAALDYVKAIDTVAYRMDPDFRMTETMQKIVDRSTRVRKGQFVLRSLRRADFAQEIEVLRDVFNDAWQDNWGFVPFTEAEFKDVGSLLKSLVDESFIKIGEIDGQPVSFIACLPNVNEAIADFNGRLLPFNWLKLLWRLKRKHPKTARVALMGVRKEYQRGLTGSGISLSMISAIREALVRRGVKEVEMGWVLEDNKSMRSIIEQIGGVVAKRYRMYEKPLVTQV